MNAVISQLKCDHKCILLMLGINKAFNFLENLKMLTVNS